MPKVVIYDFDGTIADNLLEGVFLYNKIAKEKGFKLITQENKDVLRSKGPREVMAFLGIKIFQLPSLAIRLRRDLQKVILKVKIQPGMAELLKKLASAGVRQMILTSNSRENIQEFLDRYNLNIFEKIVCGSSVFGKGKLLNEIIDEGHLDRTEVFYVGDEVRDIEAAGKAGVRMVAVAWGYNSTEALSKANPLVVVNSPEELLPFLF